MTDQAVIEAAETFGADLKFLFDLADLGKQYAAKLTPNVTAGALVPFLQQLDSQLNTIADADKQAQLAGDFARVLPVLDKVTAALGQVPSQYWFLLQPLGAFQGTDKGVVPFTLLNYASPSPPGGRYALDLGAKAGIELAAADQWPFAGDAVTDRLMRLGASGSIVAGASVAIPYHAVTVGLSANASVGLALDYYFNVPDLGQPFALAAASNLGNLPDPFDFNAVWTALTQTELEGLVYEFTGSANFKVSVSLLESADLLDLANAALKNAVTAQLGASIDVGAAINDTYTLSFRAPRTAPGRAPTVIATLGNTPGTEKDLSGSLGLTIDFSQLGGYVHSLLTKAVASWQPTLDSLKPFLQPGTWLQNEAATQLSDALQPLIRNDTLRSALLQDARTLLGLAPSASDSALADWLQGQVTGAIDRAAGVLSTDTTAATNAVLAELGRNFASFGLDDVKTAITSELQGLIKAAQDGLDGEVKTLFEKPAQALATALKDAGAISSSAFASLDQATAGVKALFDKYDQVFSAIMKASAEAAKAKVTATIAVSLKNSSTATYKFRGVFTDNGAPAAKVFQALTQGVFNELAGLLQTGASVPGFQLDRNYTSITRSLTSSQTTDFNLVFVNFGIDASTVLTAGATALVDGDGHVQINTGANLDQKFKGLNATQDISFFDTDALIVGGALRNSALQPDMEMGFAITTDDDSISRADVSTFVASLVGANLLPADALARVDAQMTKWLGAGSLAKLSGEFSAKLTLDSAQIRKLLCVDSAPSGPLTQDEAANIVQHAVSALVQAKVIDAATLKEGTAAAIGLFSPPLDGASADEAILLYPSRRSSDLIRERLANPGSPVDRFVSVADAVTGLVEMIRQARAIYLAQPQQAGVGDPGAWSLAQYLRAEQAMGNGLKPWFTSNTFLFWLLMAASPRTLALLRTVSDLCGAAGPPLHLTLTNRPASGPVETVAVV